MGLFERLGREVGQFTHDAKTAADETVTHECTACGERLHDDHANCPACGADAVVAVDADAGDADADES